jgi:hypothetical protein
MVASAKKKWDKFTIKSFSSRNEPVGNEKYQPGAILSTSQHLRFMAANWLIPKNNASNLPAIAPGKVSYIRLVELKPGHMRL